MTMSKLQGKVALVSGSGRGIGRAVALKLAQEGASVVVNDLDDEPGNSVAEEIRALGGTAMAVNGNVTLPDFGDRFVAAALDNFGGLDIIVNNAGYTWDNVIQKMTDDQWYAMIDVHLTAPFRILRAAQPAIRNLHKAETETGVSVTRKVVNISSIAGLFGNVGQTGYASAKAGVVGMTQTLAKEWGRIGVTVNCVAYGLIKTRLTADAGAGKTVDINGRDIRVGLNSDVMAAMERTIPLGRAGSPEDAAGAVFMFCQPESNYVSGQTLLCAGGLTGM
jgi:3-oxoacyl-[acyl-carrier protein] reductase